MFIVYVIKCNEEKYYIGYTNNLEKRLLEHNTGFSRWTSRYHNWRVVYMIKCDSKTTALKKEKYLKKLKGGNGFKKLLSD